MMRLMWILAMLLMVTLPSLSAQADENVQENELPEITDESLAEAQSLPVLPLLRTAPPFQAYSLGDNFHADFHGYFRARLVGNHDAPYKGAEVNQRVGDRRDSNADASFTFMRLRLNPSLRYGSNVDKDGNKVPPPIALHMQIDMLDNIVFGDNSRVGSVPLFADNPSSTDVMGKDRADVAVKRLWLEVLTPLGLFKIGRQPSHGGLGILFNDGNGFRNDFGDAEEGTTYDRIAFATRPLTIFNALTNGDKSSTPLIFAYAYDLLVEDTLGFAKEPASRNAFGNNSSLTELCSPEADGFDPDLKVGGVKVNAGKDGFCDNDVHAHIGAIIWRQPDLDINHYTDDLDLGLIFIYRTQDHTDSKIFIYDLFWKLQLSLGKGLPSLYTAAEFVMLTGEAKGVGLGGLSISEVTGRAEGNKVLDADVLNYVVRAGLKDKAWDAILEYGYSSGDENLFGDQVFKVYPMHSNYKVGLVMYPIALANRTFNEAGGISSALTSQGGVWNSTYIYPHMRFRPLPSGNLEIVAAGLMAWADSLSGGTIGSSAFIPYLQTREDPADNKCSPFQSDCSLGWEIDLAVKLRWLKRDLGMEAPEDNYIMRWSTEFGLMKAGDALSPKLQEDIIWTLQSRMAMVW